MELPEGQEWVFEMVNNILIEVLGTIAEQERVTTAARRDEGIAAARKKGVKFGRPRVEYPANWNSVYPRWKAHELTAAAAAAEMQLTRSTLYRLAERYEQKQN